MGSQVELFKLKETRPLRHVVRRKQATETKWDFLLECGHVVVGVNHRNAEVKRMRCTKCGANAGRG